MNNIERRKLERRLPLWEASLLIADKEEYKELSKKISDAKKKLGIKEEVKTQAAAIAEETPIGEQVSAIELKKKRIKRVNKELGFTLQNYGARKSYKQLMELCQYIVKLKNEYGLNDLEIASKLKVSQTYIYRMKKAHINVKYREKTCEQLTPESYCKMRNEGLSEEYIANHYEISLEMVKKFRTEKTKFIYKLYDDAVLKGKHKDNIPHIIERYNNGEKFYKIGESMGIRQAVLSRMINEKAYRYYVPAESSNKHNFTPEKYIKLKDMGLKDSDITKEYGVPYTTLCLFKKEKIESYYELKNKEINV